MTDLSKLKRNYDLSLKKLENRPEAFRSDTYDVYFKDAIFQEEIVLKMSPEDLESYDEGAGGELKEHLNGQPASMSSVASSSRFCYLSLKDTDFKVFGISNIKHRRKFEQKLPIVRGTPPHMDCYAECENELCFFECKCHEQFDSHQIILSESYFSKDRIVTKIPDKYFLEKHKKITTDERVSYCNVISPEAFGLTRDPRFDVKQFLTHIMGISAKQKKLCTLQKTTIPARLIYFYFIPDAVLESNKDIENVISQLYKEIKTVFDSQIIKNNVKNMAFELYVQFSNCVATASENNVRRIKL